MSGSNGPPSKKARMDPLPGQSDDSDSEAENDFSENQEHFKQKCREWSRQEGMDFSRTVKNEDSEVEQSDSDNSNTLDRNTEEQSENSASPSLKDGEEYEDYGITVCM